MRQPKFPDTIAETTFRPDMVLIYKPASQVVPLELTLYPMARPDGGGLQEKESQVCRPGR